MKSSKKNNKRKVRINIYGTIIALIIICVLLSIYSLKSVNTVSLSTSKNNQETNIDIVKDKNNNNEINENNSNSIENDKEHEKVDATGTEKLTYLPLGEDSNASSAKEVESMLNSWNFNREDGKKIAYLTFDDGPSDHVTNEILDILDEKNVKGTFFVLGSEVEHSNLSKDAFKRIVKEGHAIGNHGYCHSYDVLYPNKTVDANAFMADMKKSEDVMKSVIGEDFKTNVIRFPGGHGSWDTSTVDSVLEQQGYSYVDWNTLSGDAEGQNIEPEQLLNRLKETVNDLDGNNDVIVVLMHDTDAKESTAQYLGSAIDYLKSLGYEFKTLK